MPKADPAKKTTLPSGLAVDFGGTKIAAARLLDGEIVQQLQVQTDGDANTKAQIKAILDLLQRLDVDDTDDIGIAVTGRVTSAGVWHALNTNTLSKISATPLREILSDQLRRPVNVLNDATAAAIGEHLAGAGRGYHSLAFVTVSTGVGGGFILNGMPLSSDNGLVGHVGFTTSRIARNKCGSGRMQTVESIASGNAIAREAVKAGHKSLDAKSVYEAHLAGQEWATAIIEKSTEAIAELCGNLKALLDLEVVLLGGSIGLAEGYLSLVEDYLQAEPEIFRPLIKNASLGLTGAYVGVLATRDNDGWKPK